jgi:hypothetical protein
MRTMMFKYYDYYDLLRPSYDEKSLMISSTLRLLQPILYRVIKISIILPIIYNYCRGYIENGRNGVTVVTFLIFSLKKQVVTGLRCLIRPFEVVKFGGNTAEGLLNAPARAIVINKKGARVCRFIG